MIIGIDFDGTCVEHKFPYIGKDIGAQEVLRKIVESGHQLILITMRSDKLTKVIESDGSVIFKNTLEEAIEWFKENEIPLYGINHNPDQSVWTHSPKVHCNINIDDRDLGCPLKRDKESNSLYVNWNTVKLMLQARGVIKS